jgi:hypothetical protein
LSAINGLGLWLCPKSLRILRLIHTRLQPGDKEDLESDNRFNGFHFGWAQNFQVVSNFAMQTVKTVPWFVDLLLLTGAEARCE